MAFVTTAVLIELLAEQGEVNLSEPDTIRTVFQAAREEKRNLEQQMAHVKNLR